MILDLDVLEMVRSDPKRKSVMVDNGTPMVSETDHHERVVRRGRARVVCCGCVFAARRLFCRLSSPFGAIQTQFGVFLVYSGKG